MNVWPIAAGALVAGSGLSAWAACHPAAQLFGPTICRTGKQSAVALTFDDGPNPALTPRLLDLLDQQHIRASFFLIGRHVRACPQLAADIAARGHTLGNHTDTHPSLAWLSRQRTVEELLRCQEAIERAAGYRAVWMRPPYGFRGPQSDSAVRRAGLRGVVMWSRLAFDWKAQPAAPVIRRLQRVRGGDIVALHDGAPEALGADREHVLGALQHWLPRWKQAGVEFVTLDDVGPAAKP